MNQFPHEFEALLSRTGRKVLAGKHPAAGALQRGGFIAAPGLLEPKRLAGCTRLIARTFEPLLVEFTAYQLPLWHYTTPLKTRSLADRRWLVLGTFLFEGAPPLTAL